MQFVDEAVVEVQAGKGGDGALSFRRGRNLPKGGPDGGNGGNGGSIEFVGDAALNTLVDFRFSPLYRAANGGAGAGQEKTGANGPARRVRVPLGTTIIDEETRTPIGDVSQENEIVLVARGGQRGLGNAHFKSSTNRAPRQTTPGKPGEHRRLRLALKVIADVGLLGMPNAGKSTLISRVSASRPKVADYPFTTLIPNLGVVRVDQDASFVMADVPGLIAGASQGAGLGYRFLKHLSRTLLLLHLVDLQPADGSDPAANCRATLAELFAYSDAFRGRDIWLVGTKMDLPGAESALGALRASHPHRPCFGISAVTGLGVDRLVGAAMEHIATYRQRLVEDTAFAAAEESFAERIGADVLDRTFEHVRARPRRGAPDEVEVEYRRE